MKETKIISIVNQKGGVSKSTVCLNISTILQEKGYKVLMIDLDPQANLTSYVGLNPIDLDTTIVDVFDNTNSIADCIYELENLYNLCILPSHPFLSGIEIQINNKMGRESVLKRALKGIEGIFDYILIDNPPQLSLLSVNSLLASDYLLIPTDTSPITLFNIDKLIEVAGDVKDELNPSLELLGVITTMMDTKITNLDKKVIEAIRENFEVLGVLKRTVKCREGISKGLPVVITHNNSEISNIFREIAAKIIEKTAVVLKEELEVC